MIYLDYNATTPLDPQVLEAMMPYLTKHFGNAASRQHQAGREAAAAVETAREQVASVIGADPREIVWTSGATESNNLAILGVARAPTYRKRNHIVSVVTEHRAVLDPCEALEKQGYEVTMLRVDDQGRLNLDDLRASITDATLLVSVMHANNEIGVLHPIAEIGAICHERGVLFHTDAAQSFGKEPIDVKAMNIDLLSASAHKICGPKGVGFLYVRRRNPRVRCEPLIHGGGHENGMRSGTLNIPAIVGMGKAATLGSAEEQQRIRELRDRLESGILAQVEGSRVNGHPQQRLANTSNLGFEGVETEHLMKQMPDIAVSSSSACSSATRQPSYVLGAIGRSEQEARQCVRISLGRFTTAQEIDTAIAWIIDRVQALRNEKRVVSDSCE